ncbi:di-heme oxidoredictase family protein [Thiohalocapsa halophila]
MWKVCRGRPPRAGDRRRRGAADTDRGRVLFERLGCHACHLQVMTTGAAVAEALADQVIWPYSDLLLHDSAADSP